MEVIVIFFLDDKCLQIYFGTEVHKSLKRIKSAIRLLKREVLLGVLINMGIQWHFGIIFVNYFLI